MDGQASTSTPGDTSFNSSGDGSIVLHSLSDNTSGSALDSSFEALQINRAEDSANGSSLEILVHSSPARTGFFATSTAPTRAPHSRKPSLVVIDEKKELGILNPAAQAFAPVPPTNCTFETFEEIALYGKDALGDLTDLAKVALARLGLKSIPALHGPLNLPYARCASGIDAFVPTSDPEGEPWGEDEDENGVPIRQQRNLPIPLPGNARYTQAGRLAMRYSSAPAMLETGGKRFNRFPPLQRSPSQVLATRQRKQNSPAPALATPPPSRPSPPSEQDTSATLIAVQNSKAQNQRNSVAQKVQRSQKAQQGGGTQQAPKQDEQRVEQSEIQKQAAQFEADAQAFAQAQAQAIQAYYYTQAQLAQAFGGQASQAEFVASQAAAGASAAAQRAGLAANAVLNATTPRSSFSGFSQAQAQAQAQLPNIYSPPPPSFPSVPNFASPPLIPQQLPSLSTQQQQQNYVDYTNQVDSLTLLKLAGQRQLGLSPPFPIPLVNLPQQQNSNSSVPSSSRYSNFATNADDQTSFASTTQHFEQEERFIDQDYNRQAVPFTTVQNSNATGGGTGYDFLRRASSQDRRGGHSRRDSSTTTIRLDREERPATLAKPPQVVRRRRSAAPAMPYPGHSLRKGSTSSIVTVNSSLPRSAGIPQVRIFTDPPTPPTSSSNRRGSTSTARCLDDLVNSQQQFSENLNKTIRPSAAESSNNWRRPSLSLDETQLNAVAARAPVSPVTIVQPSQVEVPVVKTPAPRGRGGGGGGRKKGRGGSKTRGQPTATVSNQNAS